MAACPRCGQANPERARFCSECGAPLQPAGRPAPAEERKVVSVLFCDLVGFTASSDAADPEDVRRRIRPYHDTLRREIERYGGTVEKFIGDAVMAVFGAPVAHEDDAERAVRAALRILEAIEDLNDQDAALGLQVRIGINTGVAVVALDARPERGEGIVTGAVVNTAARLQTAAPVSAIAVGEATFRATEHVFVYEALEPVHVKGKAEPVDNWRAHAARARFGSDVTRTHTAPLVGRELELQLLQGTFERAVRDSSVQLVTLVGEPGVGKSRLVAELFAFIDARPELVRWRQGRCPPYGDGVTFWALGEIVEAEAGILETDSAEGAAAKLDVALGADVPDREWLKARLAPLVGVDHGSPSAREESFTAWRRFLETLAAENPTVCVFEDLHWADPALLAFLEHLADWSESVPLILVCTARPELYERESSWAGGKRNATTINLSPLSNAETARLVSSLLGSAILPAEVQELVLERAGGNPLYAEEFVRMLADRGVVVREGRSVRLRPTDANRLPDTLQALIAARLDTLTPGRKTLLQDASVIGKVFWAGALSAMGNVGEGAVRDALHELVRKELVRSARLSSMEGEAEYAFWHLLVRDVAYAQIPRAARAAKHRAAAVWIEQQAGERVEDVAEVLAHHYERALELAVAAGANGDVRELEVQARRYLASAGERALALDVARSEAQYARALALAPPDDPERARLLAAWAGAAQQAGRHSEAASALTEAIGTLRAQGNAPAAGRALTALSRVLWQMGDARTESVALEAVALLESEPPGAELVEAYAELAGAKLVQGAQREGVAWAERALALATELGLSEPARALGHRGFARCLRGDPGGLADLRRAVSLATRQGLGREAAVMHNNLAEALFTIEGPSSALAAYDAGIDFAERRGISEFALAIASSRLDALFALGRWDEVIRDEPELAARARRSGSIISELQALSSALRVAIARGEREPDSTKLARLEQAARESAEAQLIAAAFAVVAGARGAWGQPLLAARLLDELVHVPHVQETGLFLSHAPDLARTAIACGRVEVAEWVLNTPEPELPLHQHVLASARGAVAEARGDLPAAVDLYTEAARRWQAFGNVPERGHALLGQGRCLLALARPGADAPLRETRALFAGVGARPFVAEADALLRQALALTS